MLSGSSDTVEPNALGEIHRTDAVLPVLMNCTVTEMFCICASMYTVRTRASTRLRSSRKPNARGAGLEVETPSAPGASRGAYCRSLLCVNTRWSQRADVNAPVHFRGPNAVTISSVLIPFARAFASAWSWSRNASTSTSPSWPRRRSFAWASASAICSAHVVSSSPVLSPARVR